MAQWLGYFSGHTHVTKVGDVEDALRHAVAVFRAAGPGDRGRKAKSVRNLAGRLLAARLKLGREQNADGVESLKARAARARAEGVNGILVEFGAQDALT